MKKSIPLLLLVALLVFPALLSAAGNPEIPEDLKPWVPWVLHGQEFRQCTQQQQQNFQCLWLGKLSLDLDSKGGTFSQHITLENKGFIPLPGDQRLWPSDVKIGDQPARVLESNGKPVIYNSPGTYIVTGKFLWDRLPDYLPVNPQTALVRLVIRNQEVEFPNLDKEGKLWLQGGKNVLQQAGEQDRINLHVFRKITDEIPMRITTHLSLNVSGTPREILLGGGIPEHSIPVSVNSPIPSKIESDGKLRIQLKPGNWEIELVSRYPSVRETYAMGPSGILWPDEEVVVFDARPALRSVEIQGGVSIDPQQTTMPDAWKKFPAYRIASGDQISFVEKHRGDSTPAPDRLNLMRNIWLDFSGKGYTMRDTITGAIHRGTRLEMQEQFHLGQAKINGIGQLITRMPESENDGIEVRKGNLNLIADSRIEEDPRNFTATGWMHDFDRVTAVLNLPPGWRIWSASGVDDIPETWLHRWTLLDLFVVLILSLGIFKLWGFAWSLIAFWALILCYHEPFAPRYVFLHLLFATALLRVMSANKFRSLIRLYRNTALIALLIFVIPFTVNQARNGIYPQLERPGPGGFPAALPMGGMNKTALMEEAKAPMESDGKRMQRTVKEEVMSVPARKQKSDHPYYNLQSYRRYDPKAKIQTGPGLPNWNWGRVNLRWNGPVRQDQQVKLYLIPPWLNRILAFSRVVLMTLLLFCLAGVSYRRSHGITLAKFGIGLILCLGFSAQTARAESFPSKEILQELQTRLLEPPPCSPHCVNIQDATVELTSKKVRLRMSIDAEEKQAIPLPGQGKEWRPKTIWIDGTESRQLNRDTTGTMWTIIHRGHHQVVMEGPIQDRRSVQIHFDLLPHRLKVKAPGWSVTGLQKNDVPMADIQFQKNAAEPLEKLPALEPGTLPPFVRIERELTLGLEWTIKTRVLRLSRTGSAIIMAIPLLDGESVISGDQTIQDGKLVVNIPPQASQYEWSSVYKQTGEINLKAFPLDNSVEIWKIRLSPIWHVESTGIPVIHQPEQGVMEWHPWAGESVSLSIRRPEGVEGNTFTMDYSKIENTPGERETQTKLTFVMRSSQGGQHAIHLPKDAELQDVRINGRPYAAELLDGSVTLPVVPGRQNFEISMLEPRGMQTRFQTSRVDLGAKNVNAETVLHIPRNRWTLLVGGPVLGPAVLIWGVLFVIFLVSLGLGRAQIVPLKFHHWLLLGVGLSAASMVGILVVVAWFFAVAGRGKISEKLDRQKFNALQIFLVFLTILAMGALLGAIQHGLLGYPNMQIAGNGSHAFFLKWYMDHALPVLPQSWVISVPMMVYRILMLLWALWLSFSLLLWLKWAWSCFSKYGVWRSSKLILNDATPKHNPSHTVAHPSEGEGK